MVREQSASSGLAGRSHHPAPGWQSRASRSQPGWAGPPLPPQGHPCRALLPWHAPTPTRGASRLSAAVRPCYSTLLTMSDSPNAPEGSRQGRGAELDMFIGLGDNGDFVHVSVYFRFVFQSKV